MRGEEDILSELPNIRVFDPFSSICRGTIFWSWVTVTNVKQTQLNSSDHRTTFYQPYNHIYFSNKWLGGGIHDGERQDENDWL